MSLLPDIMKTSFPPHPDPKVQAERDLEIKRHIAPRCHMCKVGKLFISAHDPINNVSGHVCDNTKCNHFEPHEPVPDVTTHDVGGEG